MTTDNQPAPERIWADCRDLRADRFLVVRGSTKQFDSDVEYIRADLARSPVAGDATCEWQPIETCPKGIKSLLWRDSSEKFSGGWWIEDWAKYAKYNQPKFTHWQPLPAPPEEIK